MFRSLSSPVRRRLLGPILAAGLAAGCRPERVEAYRIPKEHGAALASAPTAREMPEPSAAADAAPAPSAEPGLAWTAPADWRPKALGAMRKGSFDVGGAGDDTAADLSITVFPGAVGGELANLNRWRGQVGLAPLAEGEAAAATTRLTVGELGFTIVDLVSNAAAPRRILGAMAPRDGAMWFFKLSGPDSVVAAHRAEFLDFLRSVHPAAAAVP